MTDWGKHSPNETHRILSGQHRYCRQCHPELGRDWLRAGTWGAALAGSLLFWGWVIGHLAGWMR